MTVHETYINRCIEIAKGGLGYARPNPMVGCVIVCNGTIIGEGFTSSYGGNHAEVNAINSVEDKSILNESTLYVTLEPCSHFGKTPPCSDLIMSFNIKNVVIGCQDSNPKVSGNGIKKLKDAGCDVIVGVLENECRLHHKRFFTFHLKKRPYIILKWAESKEGFLAPKTKSEIKPVWISNTFSRQRVHKWRAEEQAILAGTNTVKQDNPSLTVRNWNGQNPLRVVIDKNSKLSKDLNVFNQEAETIIISSKNIDFSKSIGKQICEVLYSKNINSVIIEGGSQTLQTFIDENLWDEARVFESSNDIKDGLIAPGRPGHKISEESLAGDILNIYIND